MPTKMPTITQRTRVVNGKPYTDYRVNAGSDGKRKIVRYCADAEKAKEVAKELYLHRKKQGALALTLGHEQLADCASAISILRDSGKQETLTRVAQEWLGFKMTVATEGATTVGTLFDSYRAALPDTLSDTHLKTVKSHSTRFEEAVGRETTCADLSAEKVGAAFDRIGGGTPKTWNNVRGYISAIFTWGVRKKIVGANPCLELDKRMDVYKEPDFFDAATVEAIMRQGSELDAAGRFMPWLVLGFFCGIRSAEIDRAKWEDVLWDERKVRIPRPKGATRGVKPRLVTLSDNGMAWLAKYRKASGKIGAGFNKFSTWKRAHLTAFPMDADNAMRHTFATMHVAMHRDVMATAFELGHYDNVRTSLQHYIGLATKTDAEKFWSIMP